LSRESITISQIAAAETQPEEVGASDWNLKTKIIRVKWKNPKK
jgi:hypothetical protein